RGTSTAWPAPLAAEAHPGRPGEYFPPPAPHPEADPAGILLQLLVAVGNVIGRTAHFAVEGDVHHLNEYLVLIGQTAKGRKGVSWGRVRSALHPADPQWADTRILGGLSSGEGLIWTVRDLIQKRNKEGN